MQKKSFSWGIIALMFFLFFPIGIWMLVKKMTDEKFNYIKNGRSLKILAWILIGFAVMYLIMGITGELETEDGSSVVGGVIVMLNETVKQGATIKVVISKGKKPSIEYQNALKQAETYSEMMHMSKKAIFDQLTSEYGGQFEDDAAQYAIDNLDADYKKNALESAKTYQSMMSMSKSAIYDQLVSEYGGQFTAEEAQYAIDHLDD